jgi:hypothetical protein
MFLPQQDEARSRSALIADVGPRTISIVKAKAIAATAQRAGAVFVSKEVGLNAEAR